MGFKKGRIAAVCVLTVAATVGMADLLRAPDQPLRFDKARADEFADPDAPIATARYREPTDAQLAAVGLMRIPAAPKPVEVATIDTPPVIPPYDMARLSPPPHENVEPDRDGVQTAQGPDPKAMAAMSRKPKRGVALASAEPATGGDPIGARGRTMLAMAAPTPADRRRGRWFIFAAASDKAFGLSLVRDETMGRLRQAGWSVERLAAYGQVQAGIGWRKLGGQVSLLAARREIGDIRVRVRDTVAGISVSWRAQET